MNKAAGATAERVEDSREMLSDKMLEASAGLEQYAQEAQSDFVAERLHQASDAALALAETVETIDPVEDLREFAQDHTLLFAGASFTIGLFLSRLLRSRNS